MFNIVISHACSSHLPFSLKESMHRLRAQVFHERLGWAVRCDSQGRELDIFDTLDPLYLIATESRQSTRALGCWRLLPSTGPYMLRDVFPQLLGGQAAPSHERIWEISRFAVDAEVAGGSFGFSELPAEMLRAMVRYAVRQGIEAIVGVTGAPIERMLRKLGFEVQRYAPPQRIGSVMSVGFCLPMTTDVQWRVCGELVDAAPELPLLPPAVRVPEPLEIRA